MVNRERAILAGGCFWGMEDIIRKKPGVISTQVGYIGGETPHPSYPLVKTGKTGHAEAVEILFEPDKISYRDLLLLFFKMHDPTTPDQQGGDIGSQYRSCIFVTSDEQFKVASEVKEYVQTKNVWGKPLVTEIMPAPDFHPAEDYHQLYLEKNPGGYTCHFLREIDL